MLVFISNFIQKLFRYIISVIFVLGVKVGVVFIIFGIIWVGEYIYNLIPDSKITYEEALSKNNSKIWYKFLEQNPEYKGNRDIQDRITRIEVDEILGHKDTGALPQAERQSSQYSENSRVEIENRTGCLLTIRYVGNSVLKRNIVQGRSETLYLKSGYYKVAASACNKNYGTTENLSGDYSVSYYITRR
ncbi:hypothetical protein PHA51_09210 [Rodentibacter pneumotropicus]|uniref:DUF6759 domain-containing protein n=1 Tax=Rodentibacter pneumotropicus TaxID=758 RepID=UPI00232C7D84|nr:DUF6759 domain-containing protein [Rodentibacter pneumotropicus]MDC2826203.1 hypothetical protein [Rodentibacter pneumotropicus]